MYKRTSRKHYIGVTINHILLLTKFLVEHNVATFI